MPIIYQPEPTPLQCGQAVLAMLSGRPVAEIVACCGTDRETTLKQMRETLLHYGIICDGTRRPVTDRADLPPIALLSLETPACWHWSLYADGVFYDPAYGLRSDFPPSTRRYYWEIHISCCLSKGSRSAAGWE